MSVDVEMWPEIWFLDVEEVHKTVILSVKTPWIFAVSQKQLHHFSFQMLFPHVNGVMAGAEFMQIPLWHIEKVSITISLIT